MVTNNNMDCAVAAIGQGQNSPLPRDERHELLVTYEGPSHPTAASCVSSNNNVNRQTFCFDLPPSGTDPRSGSSYVSHDDLLARLSAKIGWPSSLLCIVRQRRRIGGALSSVGDRRLLFPTHSLENAAVVHHQHAPYTIAIAPRHAAVVGGKGGFGTLLKGQSKQAGARTTLDFGACRDLSGRRLRHVNDEIKLRKWRELQAQREKAKEGGGLGPDEIAALKTPSGIRNWHLMVPSWSEGAAFSNKGRRKIERQLEKEVRGWQSKEERARGAKEQKRLDEEWAVMEYVRRGEAEGERVMGKTEDVKEGILAHLRKRKQEQKEKEQQKKQGEESKSDLGCKTKQQFSGGDGINSVSIASEKIGQFVDDAPGEKSLASHLMTLSGEMSVFDITDNNENIILAKEQGPHPPQPTKQLRLQSQSDFATAVVLLNAAKLKVTPSTGVYIEYIIRTAGLSQIGWIRSPEDGGSQFLPNSDTGDGVGDDPSSFGFDGSRGLKFHGGKEVTYGFAEDGKREGKEKHPIEWKAGDVLGCWCKYANAGEKSIIEIGYSLNGTNLGVAFGVSTTSDVLHFYPAVSLNLKEVVDVNVGPDFAYDVKEGCVGACDLVKTEIDASGNEREGDEGDVPNEADVISKPNVEDKATDDDVAPPRKRPREELTAQSATKSDEEEPKRETFDLNQCSSIDELTNMGPDRLKNILLSMGVKCGGTPEERAKRLFSLKGLRREEYPNKVRGKNFVP